MRTLTARIFPALGLMAVLALASGCGSSASSSSGGSQNNGGGGGGGSTSNTQPIAVNFGPVPNSGYADAAFTSVTLCSPGSSTNCQTISGVLVDTGSFGLRILSSALTITLPQQNDGSGNPIAECGAFASGVTWGPVQTADIKIAGEVASSIPIQIIGSANFPTVPNDCSSQGAPMDNLASLGANGILGVGQSIQDCGAACASGNPLGAYYTCPSSRCTDTTESVAMQVQNPVASFATDNNGVIVELPAVSTPTATLSGSLIFGIGTQSNNGLGSTTTVFGTDDFGDFSASYQGVSYLGFLDSGSNGVFFLDSTILAVPVCAAPNDFLYCPSSTQTFTLQNTAQTGGAMGSVTVTVGNGDLLSQGNNAAINGLAGPGTLPGFLAVVDYGLPFFFGRNVYTAFVGKSTPGGTGPYTAY
jgi:uncharacterized protein DUF3443